jgi:TATA-binding protein-associated factor
VEILGEMDFFFVVLDEGHLIKNPKNKTAQATKKLKARHKFLLSGTPI